MANYREIRNLKTQLSKELDLLDKKPQYGLEIYIEYEYLLNTDLNWLIDEIRYSIIKSLDIPSEERRKLVLTFRIHQVSTEHSILLLITVGIVSGFIAGLLSNFAYDLLKNGYKQMKERVDEKDISINTRDNLDKITIKPVIVEKNKIKYYDRKKPIEIKRDKNHPRWVRY